MQNRGDDPELTIDVCCTLMSGVGKMAAAAVSKPAEMKMKTLPVHEAASESARWSPYIINGGYVFVQARWMGLGSNFADTIYLYLCMCVCDRTAMAVAGADFCVVAGDTRMSKGYSISCRSVPKAYQLYVM